MSDDATSLQDIMMILMILMMTSRTEQCCSTSDTKCGKFFRTLRMVSESLESDARSVSVMVRNDGSVGLLMALPMMMSLLVLRQPTLSPSKLPTQARNVASISSSLSPRWREWGTKGVWSPERERQREQVVRARQRQSTNE